MVHPIMNVTVKLNCLKESI